MNPMERIQFMQAARESILPPIGSPAMLEVLNRFNALLIGRLVGSITSGCTDEEFKQLVEDCKQQTLEWRRKK